MWRWRATYNWKFFDEGYNFGSYFNRSLHTKLWASKVAKVPILGISGLPFGCPKTKWHLGVGLMAKHREYYKGEGNGFPQVQAVVNFMSLCLLVPRPCCNYALTNLLFGLCRSVWVIDLLVTLFSPYAGARACPFTRPPWICKLRSAPWLLILPLFSNLDS
jgi:hypothetical protein